MRHLEFQNKITDETFIISNKTRTIKAYQLICKSIVLQKLQHKSPNRN